MVEWACVLCGHHIQNDWVSRATHLHQILCEAWTFLCGNYLDDSEGHSYGQQSPVGDWQLHHDNVPLMHHVSCRVCFEKHQLILVTQLPCSPGLASCNFWLFPKLKTCLEGKTFQTISEIQGNMRGKLMVIGDWENCVRSQGAYFEGNWGIIVLCTMFLVSHIFFSKCLYFSHHKAGNLLDIYFICGFASLTENNIMRCTHISVLINKLLCFIAE